MNYNSWDLRFLLLAQHISTWSKDPSTKVGAVLVDDQRRIVSVGYNGYAQGLEDTEKRLNDRDLKYRSIIHAERNAILFAQRSVKGMTLYTYPFMTCASCASLVIQSGITKVVAPASTHPRWIENFEIAQGDFKEARVELILIEPKELFSLNLENKLCEI